MGGYVPRVAVVGGGVSGLVLAKQLAARGIHATVFDTGEHACGGRASSRDVTTDQGRQHSFDHSTQYFTASPGSRFEAMTKTWASEGLIAEWPQGRVGTVAVSAAEGGPSFVAFADDAKRFIGVGGLRPLCDFLAEGASEVVRPQWVGAMTPVGGDGANRRWELASGPGGKRLGTYDFVAISHNGKCAARLASTAKNTNGSGAADKVERSLQCAFGIRPTPELAKQRKLILSSVWALMLVTDQPVQAAAFEGAHIAGCDVISWASNVTAKRRHGNTGGGRGGGGGQAQGQGEGECWVVHSTPQFARDHKCPQESVPAEVAKQVTGAMKSAFEAALGVPAGSLKTSYTRVQLWGAANPLTAAGVPAVFDSATRSGACGDWCEGPPSVQAAAESALALADAIEAVFKPTTAKHPGAAAALDAAIVRWAPCSGGAAALGSYPGTTGVPAMAEVAAVPGGGRSGQGGGGRGGRGRNSGAGGRADDRGRSASPKRGRGSGGGAGGGKGAGRGAAAGGGVGGRGGRGRGEDGQRQGRGGGGGGGGGSVSSVSVATAAGSSRDAFASRGSGRVQGGALGGGRGGGSAGGGGGGGGGGRGWGGAAGRVGGVGAVLFG